MDPANRTTETSASRPVVLACGGRDFTDWKRACKALDALAPKPKVIVHGDASGADQLADKWAQVRQVAVRKHPADWTELGRAAGPIRNQEMLEQEKPDYVVAFPGGRGTSDLVSRAREMRIPVHFR